MLQGPRMRVRFRVGNGVNLVVRRAGSFIGNFVLLRLKCLYVTISTLFKSHTANILSTLSRIYW